MLTQTDSIEFVSKLLDDEILWSEFDVLITLVY